MYTIFLWVLIGLTAFCAYRGFTAGLPKWLNYAGCLLLPLTFYFTIMAGVSAELYGGGWKVPVVLLPLALLSWGLIAAGKKPFFRISEALGMAAFAFAAFYLTMCMGYYRRVLVMAESQKKLREAIPAADYYKLIQLAPEQQGDMARRLAGALADDDKFVKIGALQALRQVSAHAAPALPAVGKIIESGDPETLDYAVRLAKDLGPAAGELLPALKARAAAETGPYPPYAIEDAITVISSAAAGAEIK